MFVKFIPKTYRLCLKILNVYTSSWKKLYCNHLFHFKDFCNIQTSQRFSQILFSNISTMKRRESFIITEMVLNVICESTSVLTFIRLSHVYRVSNMSCRCPKHQQSWCPLNKLCPFYLKVQDWVAGGLIKTSPYCNPHQIINKTVFRVHHVFGILLLWNSAKYNLTWMLNDVHFFASYFIWRQVFGQLLALCQECAHSTWWHNAQTGLDMLATK